MNSLNEKWVLQPSCSEAVSRINLSKLTEDEIAELKFLLEDLSKDGKYEEWYETSWSESTIFGNPVITISGETPYNSSEWLEEKLRSLPFGKNLEIEWD